jgi:uncharacterized protein YukE
MDTLLGIGAVSSPFNVGMIGANAQSVSLLAAELSLSTPDLLNNTSAIVNLSGEGQLLTAAATFQDQLRSLQPGTATSGGGQNFGTDLASLSAETQSFVDAFNGLQSTISNISESSNYLGGNVTGASGLVQSLNTLAQTNYSTGNPMLSNLSQLGIIFKPSLIPGGAGSLSINLSTLQSAFNANATDAFSLLSNAASAFGNLAGNFVGQAGNQYSSLAALAQASPIAGSLTDYLASSLFSQAQSNGGLNLNNILLNESLNGTISFQQAVLASNEYSMVSSLLG